MRLSNLNLFYIALFGTLFLFRPPVDPQLRGKGLPAALSLRYNGITAAGMATIASRGSKVASLQRR